MATKIFGAAKRPAAALAVGAAPLTLALAQGGPVPVLNSTRAAGLFAALAAIYPACGLALGFVARLISKRAEAEALEGSDHKPNNGGLDFRQLSS